MEPTPQLLRIETFAVYCEYMLVAASSLFYLVAGGDEYLMVLHRNVPPHSSDWAARSLYCGNSKLGSIIKDLRAIIRLPTATLFASLRTHHPVEYDLLPIVRRLREE